MKSSDAAPCGNGFTCGSGALNAEPSSLQGGGLCPAGEYCSVLNVDSATGDPTGPQECADGYYNPD